MIAIVTDSTAYLTRREAREYGVRIIPQIYRADGQIHYETYADELTEPKKVMPAITGEETRRKQTEQFERAFRDLSEKGFEILCITLSSRLGSSYYNAVSAAQSLRGKRIEVIDSQMTAGGMYLMIKQARRLAYKGCSIDEIVSALYLQRANIYLRFTIEEMNTLISSRRLGSIRKGALGTLLNNKPILFVNSGKVFVEDTAMGNTELMRKMFAKIPRGTEYLIINYSRTSVKLEMMMEIAHRMFPEAIIEPRRIGPVLTGNLGDTVLGVVWSK